MLTARGWWFFLVVLIMLTLGVAADAVALVLVCLTLLAWFLGAWLVFAMRSRLLAGRLRVVREVSDDRGPIASLWTGRTFRVRAQLHLDGSFGSLYVRVADRVPFAVEHVSGAPHDDAVMAAGQPVLLNYEVFCPAPGVARFEGVGVHFADLQGFFCHFLCVRDVRAYRILPPLGNSRVRVSVPKRHNVLPLLGTHRLRRPGTGSELLDLRDYLPGDPPRTIAWKASARRDRLMTKEFESEVPVRCTLFVDTSHSVRIGSPGRNALARLVEITAAIAQASAGARDLIGLCLFDEQTTSYVRPARAGRHLVRLANHLADAAALAPATGAAAVSRLLPRAYGLARELYPEQLARDVNVFPWWLAWLSPRPAYTVRVPPLRARSALGWPGTWLRRRLRGLGLRVRQALLARLSPWQRMQYRWRKQLAALLSVRYGLAPGGLALLLEDEAWCSLYLQRFLAEHQVPYPLPFYDAEGRYLFAAPGKVDTLAAALLRAVRHGRDNELFVLLADFLEIVEHLGPVLAAVQVARARHHQVILVCPWPAAVPPPLPQTELSAGLPPVRGDAHATVAPPAAVRWATTQRFQRAFHQVRRTFARLGVPVVCARDSDAVSLILNRLERLRVQERGRR